MRLLHPNSIGQPQPLAETLMPHIMPIGNGKYAIVIGAFEVEFDRIEWEAMKHQVRKINNSPDRAK